MIAQLKKVLKKLPEFIQNIVDKMFDKNYSLFSFKHDYDPDEFDKREREKSRKKEQERKQQYSYDYYDEEEELEKNYDDGMEI